MEERERGTEGGRKIESARAKGSERKRDSTCARSSEREREKGRVSDREQDTYTGSLLEKSALFTFKRVLLHSKDSCRYSKEPKETFKHSKKVV